VRVSDPRIGRSHSPSRLLAAAGIEIDQVLASAANGAGRWAAFVRPCQRAGLDRALAPLAPAGGGGGTFVSLPLFDVE
jgi:hypothetical protein